MYSATDASIRCPNCGRGMLYTSGNDARYHCDNCGSWWIKTLAFASDATGCETSTYTYRIVQRGEERYGKISDAHNYRDRRDNAKV